MESTGETGHAPTLARNWTWFLLVILSIEKVIQHTFVTIAFILDIGGIKSKVAVSPNPLMIAGAIVAVLFVISLLGLLGARKWAINLLIGLALFDILGEFIAQGRMDIVIPLSFLAAVLILIFALVYRAQTLRTG
jgi:hypothetical protein